ncbi:MAG TPA: amino acid transporter [Gammaproteobacteria bacterium]|nr:amino acid transporter [Acidiferrobacteraceae bacterium]MDP6551593.1 LysE family transporter [Arenicellales bacterium]MDP6790576.1 LysE family transporter [Arenicellales bacterium]MDP6919246.1 LysE family transporter [Arenicellales bacterium]HCX88670.1 amino acid transporter [Gammaproteobacteria bacterium]
MNILALWEGLALGSALIIAIGAQNAFVLRQGLARQHVFAVCTVCFGGDVLLISVGAGGLGTAFRADPLILQGVAWAGTLFLWFFAFRAFARAARPRALLPVASGDRAESLGTAVTSALAVTFLNPHVYLDTVLLLGGVAARFAGGERIMFACGAALASLLWFYGLGFGAAHWSRFISRPQTWRVIDIGIGLMMGLLAVSLGHWAWSHN